MEKEFVKQLAIVLLCSRLIVLIFTELFEKFANEQEIASFNEEGEEVIFRKHIEFFYTMIKLGNSGTIMTLFMMMSVVIKDLL